MNLSILNVFLIIFKSHFLLKNNWSLISVNRRYYPHSQTCPLQMDLNHQMVGVYISRGWGRNEDGPVNSGPPGPRRGISSSLQGVWQACSPINHYVHLPPPSVDKGQPVVVLSGSLQAQAGAVSGRSQSLHNMTFIFYSYSSLIICCSALNMIID